VLDDALILEHYGNRATLFWTATIACAKPSPDAVTVSVKSDLSPPGPWAVTGRGSATETGAKVTGAVSLYQKIPIATLDAPQTESPATFFTQDQSISLLIAVRPSLVFAPGSSMAQAQYSLKPLDYLLLTAARRGNMPAVEELLESGASVDSANLENKTALMMAASKGHLGVVKLLLDRGAKINVRTKGSPFITSAFGSKRPGGWSALAAAASSGNTDVVRMLLERGASVQAGSEDQMSPLTAAINGRNAAIVKLLLEKGADANTLDDLGYSPLAKADIDGRGAIARVLKNHGGRITVPWDIVPRRQ